MQPKILLAAAALLSSTASAFVMPSSWNAADDKAAVDDHSAPQAKDEFHALPFDTDAPAAADPVEPTKRILARKSKIELVLPYTRDDGKGTLLLAFGVRYSPVKGNLLTANNAFLYSSREGPLVDGPVTGALLVPQSDVILVGDEERERQAKAAASHEGGDDAQPEAKICSPEGVCVKPTRLCIREGVCLPAPATLPLNVMGCTVERESDLSDDGERGSLAFTLQFIDLEGESTGLRVPRVTLYLAVHGRSMVLTHAEIKGEDAQWATRLPSPYGNGNGNHGGRLPHRLPETPAAPAPEAPAPEAPAPEAPALEAPAPAPDADKDSLLLPELKKALKACDSLLCRWKVILGTTGRMAAHHCGGAGMRGKAVGGADRPSFPHPPPLSHPPPPPPFGRPPHHGEEEDHPPFPPPPPAHHKGHKEHKEHKDHAEHKDHEHKGHKDHKDHAEHKDHAHGPHHHHHHHHNKLAGLVSTVAYYTPALIYVVYIMMAVVVGSYVGGILQRLVQRVFYQERKPDAEEAVAVDEKEALMAADAKQDDSALPPYAEAADEKTAV